jgi:hypothetical protein
MSWHWQSTCSACAFVSNQLGSRTLCPSHAGLVPAATSVADHSERGEPCAMSHPTADRPWPFTAREYARLLILRSRLQDQRQHA